MSENNQQFIPAPRPLNDVPRLRELYDLELIEGGREERFDRYTRFVSDLFDKPVALMTLMDQEFQWFKSCFGVEMDGTPRDISFCSFTMLEQHSMVIEDTTKDTRVMYSPLVIGEPHVRFYAGVILRGPNNHILGTLCIIDFKPGKFSEQDLNRFITLGKMVENEFIYDYHLTSLKKKVESSILYDSRTDMPSRRLFCERLNQTIVSCKKLPNPNYHVIVGCLTIQNYESLKVAKGEDIVAKLIKDVGNRLSLLKISGLSFGLSSTNQILVYSDVPTSQKQDWLTTVFSISESSFLIDEEPVLIDITLGYAIHGMDGDDPYEILEKAVIASNLAKRKTTSILHYGDCPVPEITTTYNMEHLLHQAIIHDNLHLEFQPIFDINSGKIVAAEALCRWTDVKLGSIAPKEFIALAEETGLIYPLGDWVVRKAMAAVMFLERNCGLDFPILVNITARQLLKNDLLDYLKTYIEKENFPKQYINFEVTESSLVYDMSKATENMKKACGQGFRFCLDDFGVGLSSLNHLRELPVTQIKVDKVFVEQIANSERDRSFLDGIIKFAQGIHLNVIVGGIESSEQIDVLKSIGCNHVQGKYLCNPLELVDFKEYLQNRSEMSV